jgi:hypothetical protein
MAMRSKSRALTIDEVRARFEEWRRNRQGKRSIPDELWSAAAARMVSTVLRPNCTSMEAN